jgi:hypothetical protein
MTHRDDPDELRGEQLAAYYRRRADMATDVRLAALEASVHELDSKVDRLSTRLAVLAGALGILSLVANIVGPVIAEAIVKGYTP